MSGRPAVQELPLQDAIASARDWNRALQQSAVARQAVAAQQAPLAQPLPHTVTPPPAKPQGRDISSLGAQHAQHDGATNSNAEVAASADAGQQHSSPAQAQHAQHDDDSSNNAAATQHQAEDSGRPSSNHPGSSAADAQAGSLKKKKETSLPTSSSSEASLGDQPSSMSGQSPQPGTTYAQGDNSPQLTDHRQQPGEPNSAPEQPQPPSSAQSQSHPGPQAQSHLQSESQQQQQQQPPTSPEERQHQQQQQQHEVSAEQKQCQQPQLPTAQQQQQQQQQSGQQANAPSEGQAPAVATALGMLPAFPAMDDLKCVLGGGEQMTMLDGLQGTLAGLAVKVLTGLVSSFFTLFAIVFSLAFLVFHYSN